MSYSSRVFLVVSLFILSGCANTGNKQITQTHPIEKTAEQVDAAAATATEPALPAVEAKADALLKQMGDFLASKSVFSFQAITIREQVIPTGQKLQYDANVNVKVRRPDGLFAETVSGAKHKRFWYNGRNFSLLDVKHNLYAATEAPSTIDNALDYAMDEYGVAMPLSDFVFTDPYQTMSENNGAGFYVALTEVNGIKTHHLAFRQASVDWQIWINAEGDPTPVKFVITYSDHPSIPQFMAFFKDWNFKPNFNPEAFVFVAPAESAKIEFNLESTMISEEVMK